MFKIDHDYHIHSQLSTCSNDPEQNANAILRYAINNGFNKICITDHFWDEKVAGASSWYRPQNYAHVSSILPLPESDTVKFCFGCETDLDKNMTLGISEDALERFDFIIIPTTHLHMTRFTIEEGQDSVQERAEIYVNRLDKLMDMSLPFEKIGIAHLTCPLLAYDSADFDKHLRVLDTIDDKTYAELFTKIAKKGAGFELNFTVERYSEEQYPRLLRPYKIARDVGCRFYLGSDAHNPRELDNAFSNFTKIIDLLKLEEKDQFRF